jgi:hypothetical protein
MLRDNDLGVPHKSRPTARPLSQTVRLRTRLVS